MVKKSMTGLSAVFLTMLLLCGTAFADNTVGTVNTTDSSVTIEQTTSGGNGTGDPVFRVTKNSGVTAGEIYLILIQQGGGSGGRPDLPTRDNVFYINCDTASGTSISFNAYPRELAEGSYTVYLSDYTGSNGGAARSVGTFEVSGSTNIPGDADCNGVVNADDLATIINYIVNKVPFPEHGEQAADVTGDNVVDGNDLATIINFIVNKVPIQ